MGDDGEKRQGQGERKAKHMDRVIKTIEENSIEQLRVSNLLTSRFTNLASSIALRYCLSFIAKPYLILRLYSFGGSTGSIMVNIGINRSNVFVTGLRHKFRFNFLLLAGT